MSFCSRRKRSSSDFVMTTGNTGQSGNQPAADVAPDLHSRNAQVNGGFFDFESASFAKFMTFKRFFEQSAELAWNLCIGVHDANANTPT